MDNFLELKKEQTLDEKPKKWDEAECRTTWKRFRKTIRKQK